MGLRRTKIGAKVEENRCRCGPDGTPIKHGPEGRAEVLARIRRDKQAQVENEQESEFEE